MDFTGRDGKALRELLARNGSLTTEEITDRWRRSLTLPRGARVFGTFVAQWNEYAAGAGAAAAAGGPRGVIADVSDFNAPGARDYT